MLKRFQIIGNQKKKFVLEADSHTAVYGSNDRYFTHKVTRLLLPQYADAGHSSLIQSPQI